MGPNLLSYKDALAKPRPPDASIDSEEVHDAWRLVESDKNCEDQKAVDEQKYVENHLRVTYNLPFPTTTNMIIESHINFLKALKQAAPEMIIVPNNSRIKPHSSISCLPRTERAFTKQFTVINEERRSNSTSSSRVTICHSVRTNETIKNIRMQTKNGFQQYLDGNHITVRRDQFRGEEICPVGFLILVHPELANRDCLHDQVRAALVNHSSNFQVPEFAIVAGKISYGNSTDRITTKILDIICSKSAFLVMKDALVGVFRHEHMRRSCGQFIPRGHGYDSHYFKSLLLQHDKFLTNTYCFSVLGLTRKAANHLVQVTGSKHKKSILQWLKGSQAITDIHPTNTTDSDGKWFVITTIPLAEKAKSHIDSIMPALYKHVPHEIGYRCEGYYLPVRLKQGRSDTPPIMSVNYNDQNLPQSIFITDTPELSASTESSSMQSDQASIAGTDATTKISTLPEHESRSNHSVASNNDQISGFGLDVKLERLLTKESKPDMDISLLDLGLAGGVDLKSVDITDRPRTINDSPSETEPASDEWDQQLPSGSMQVTSVNDRFQPSLETVFHDVSENCGEIIQDMIEKKFNNSTEAEMITRTNEIELLRAEFNEIVNMKFNAACTMLHEKMEKMNRCFTESIEKSFNVLSSSMIEQNSKLLEQIVSLSIQVNSLQMNAMQMNTIPSLVQQFQQQQQIAQNHNLSVHSNPLMANLTQQTQEQQQLHVPSTSGLMQTLMQQYQQQHQQLEQEQHQLRQNMSLTLNNLSTSPMPQNLRNQQQYGYMAQPPLPIQPREQPHVFSSPQPPIPPTQYSTFAEERTLSVSQPKLTIPLSSSQTPISHQNQLHNSYDKSSLFPQEQEPYSLAF